MLRLIVVGLAIAMGVILAGPANSQTNPGFNPDLSWCNVQGSLAIRGPAKWQCLQPGTAGQSLLTGGPGALPYWNTITGTGTVTSVSGSGGTTGLTLTGGPITGAGTLTLGGTLAAANGGTGTAGAANTAFISNGTVGGWSLIGGSSINSGVITNTHISSVAGIVPSKFATQPSMTVLANITGGAAVPTTPTVSALLDANFSPAQGAVLYRNVSGWSQLPAGLSGQFLSTGGTGANPSWQTVQGGNLGTIPNGTVLGNISGSSAAPANPTVTQLLDATLGNTQGQILYRNATVWTVLAPGTAGAFLQTGGAAVNPVWSTIGQIKGTGTNNNATAGNIGEEIFSQVLTGSAIAMTTGGAIYQIASLSLTAGDWDVSGTGSIQPNNGVSVGAMTCSIGPTSVAINADQPGLWRQVIPFTQVTSGGFHSLPITPFRVSLSTTTTYYLNCAMSGGVASGAGFLRARRMR